MRIRTISILSAALLFGLPGLVAAQDNIVEPRVTTHNIRLFTTGGGGVAEVRGLESLYINPAAYAHAPGQFALFSAGGGLYIAPNQIGQVVAGVLTGNALPTPGSIAVLLKDQIAETGYGFGGSAGMGYTGNSLGIGIISDLDVYMRNGGAGSPPVGHLLAEASLVGGLAVPFELGPVDLSVGADIRPFVRVRSDLSDSDSIEAYATGTPFLEAFAEAPTLNGLGLGLNAGVSARYDDFSAAFVVRDIGGTRVVYREHGLATVFESALGGVLPPGGDDPGALYDPDDQYSLPTQTRFGVAWTPDFGDVVQPRLFADARNLHRVFVGDFDASTAFSVGGAVELARFITLRGGLGDGGVTLGGGMQFGALRLDGGFEFGNSAPSRGVLEFGVRF